MERIFSNRHAFLIAVQEYQNSIPSLSTPVKDVELIGSILRDKYGFEIHICNANPSKDKLEEFLKSIPLIVGNGNEDDTQILIYFAGHGVGLNSDTGIKGYLLPSTAYRVDNDGKNILAETSVSMDFLVGIIDAIKAQQILLVLDCCFAGLIRWASQSTHRGLDTDGNEGLYRQQFYYNTRHKVRQVFTSSSYDQRVVDLLGVRDDTNQNSPFVRFLSQALQGEADRNRDDVLVLEEIQTYVSERLTLVIRQLNRDQTTGFYPLESHDCGSFLFFPKNFDPRVLDPKEVTNPFKGLQTYGVNDKDIYPGRQQVIDDVLDCIHKRQQEGGGIIIVSGVSGSGKSSLVRAGVIPRLPNHTSIPIVVPGRTPLILLEELQQSVSDIVVVDQLEQIITQATNNSETAISLFLEKLIDLNKIVICTIRTDFEIQIFKNKSLSDDPLSIYRMPRLEREDIRYIILKPAMLAGRFFYPQELIDTIIDDFLNYPNALPLLSLMMYELFEQCKQDIYHEITPKDYADIGKLTGVLNRKLETLYSLFSAEDDRKMLQNILLRMTSLRGGKLTAQRVYSKELQFKGSNRQQIRDQIIKTLAAEGNRLILALNEYIEPTHDVVVQAWSTQRKILTDINNGTLNLRETLTLAIDDYRHYKENTSYLWSSDPNLLLLGSRPNNFWSQLKWDWLPFERAFHQQLEWFTKWEETFVRKSFNRRKLGRLSIRLLMTVIILALIGVSYFLYQLIIEQRKTKAAYLISEAQNMRSYNPSQSLWLLKAAFNLNPDDIRIFREITALYEKDGMHLEKAIYDHDSYVTRAIFSPDGKNVLTASWDKTAKLWNLKGELLVNLNNHTGVVSWADFSPDGKYIVTASHDKTAKIWDLKGRLLTTLRKHGDILRHVVFSPNSDYILTASTDSSAKLWNIKGDLLFNLRKHTGSVNRAIFSHDGKYILTASEDSTARLWNMKGKSIRVFKHLSEVNSISFSPDSKSILTASSDGTAKLWQLNGKILLNIDKNAKKIDIGPSAINQAIFSPDGRQILTASSNGVAELWNLNGNLLARMDKHNNSIVHIAFSTNGSLISTSSSDGTAKIWNKVGDMLLDINKHSSTVYQTYFSPNNSQILTASDDKSAKLWELKSELTFPLGEVSSVIDKRGTVAVSKQYILTASNNNSAKLWNLNGNLIAELKDHHIDRINYVTISPNTNYLLTASDDNTAKLWNSKGKLIADLNRHVSAVDQASFSFNGKKIVTASDDGTGKMWDLKGKELARFDKNRSIVSQVLLAPNDRDVLVISFEDTTRLYNTNGAISAKLAGHSSVVNYGEFSPEGKFIVTASEDNTAKLWNLQGKVITNLNHANGVNHATFSPNGNYILTASHDNTAKLWNIRGKLISELNKHTKSVNNGFFSHSGEYIITASEDGSAKIWNFNGDVIADYNKHSSEVKYATFSLDDNYIITVDNQYITMWYTPKLILKWLETAQIAPLRERLKIEYQIK